MPEASPPFDPPVAAARGDFFGVVKASKALHQARWTVDRELALDEFRACKERGEHCEIWRAERMATT